VGHAAQPGGRHRLAFGSVEWYEPPVWPEQPGEPTKMMPFEVGVDDLELKIARVIGAGGSAAPHQPPDRDPRGLRVMLDPAGHPFCLFVLSE